MARLYEHQELHEAVKEAIHQIAWPPWARSYYPSKLAVEFDIAYRTFRSWELDERTPTPENALKVCKGIERYASRLEKAAARVRKVAGKVERAEARRRNQPAGKRPTRKRTVARRTQDE